MNEREHSVWVDLLNRRLVHNNLMLASMQIAERFEDLERQVRELQGTRGTPIAQGEIAAPADPPCVTGAVPRWQVDGEVDFSPAGNYVHVDDHVREVEALHRQLAERQRTIESQGAKIAARERQLAQREALLREVLPFIGPTTDLRVHELVRHIREEVP